MSSNRVELRSLRRILSQADLAVSSANLPENRTARCRELLQSAIGITDDLLEQAKLPAAAELGKRGGSKTAKRGSEYFRQLAAKRKTFGGGRPKNEAA